jgi:hypothetical protein
MSLLTSFTYISLVIYWMYPKLEEDADPEVRMWQLRQSGVEVERINMKVSSALSSSRPENRGRGAFFWGSTCLTEDGPTRSGCSRFPSLAIFVERRGGMEFLLMSDEGQGMNGIEIEG